MAKDDSISTKAEAYYRFYEEVFSHVEQGALNFLEEIDSFVRKYGLADKKVLEIGSGRGEFQDAVFDYTGLDIAHSLKQFYHKAFVIVRDGEAYPFRDNVFDAIFTRATFEHIPSIEKALTEMVRVLRPGGMILFDMAWQVRSWANKALNARPYKELTVREKIIKFSILWRDNLYYRLLFVVPKRFFRTLLFIIGFYKDLDYKKLVPSYEALYDADSDACNHVDPHAMILWFLAHGCEVLNYPNPWKAFFVRSGSLIVKKK